MNVANPDAKPDAAVDAKALYAKISWRLIPYIFFLYILAYLDRVNVGFAALEMRRDLALSATVYGTGAGIFFLGQAMFDLPSNLLLGKVGPRLWIARIMISWGIIATLHGAGQRPAQLLRHAPAARRIGGRLLSRHDPLPLLLVPLSRARPRRRQVHDRHLARRRRRRSYLQLPASSLEGKGPACTAGSGSFMRRGHSHHPRRHLRPFLYA